MGPWSRPPVTLCTELLLEEGEEVINMEAHQISSGGRDCFSSPHELKGFFELCFKNLFS